MGRKKKHIEHLIEFRIVSDNKDTRMTRIEIRTTDRTLYDTWGYNEPEDLTYRVYDNNIKNYCDSNNISTIYYFKYGYMVAELVHKFGNKFSSMKARDIEWN